ncbi:pseudouridine synthase [Paludibacterium paludis]|uniref:Pseudouridine synthase n=2 Tax=Paludibacterium paludis TaxID=1225769 RepID=A0A918U9C8_9NEIS|nr:pseudouridine synthase [Paludibacterium paludis]
MQQQGFGSRKECRQLIEAGLVLVDGEEPADYRQAVEPASVGELVVDGEIWEPVALPLYLMMHKPAGYETSHKPMHHPSVFSLLPWQFSMMDISAVGRLDVDTTGLLLFTTDGRFVHALTSPRRHVPKCYEILLKHPVDEAFAAHLKKGVFLRDDNERVAADAVELVDEITVRMTISQGKYHQVKRMVAAAGNRVSELHRLAFGELELGSLEEGQWRHLSGAERGAFGF